MRVGKLDFVASRHKSNEQSKSGELIDWLTYEIVFETKTKAVGKLNRPGFVGVLV